MFGINMNIDMEKYRKRFKFYGKLVTYWSLVLALAGVVQGNVIMVSSGLSFITVGCILHKFSED